MISYELCKVLKDAGFPQNPSGICGHCHGFQMNPENFPHLNDDYKKSLPEYAYHPTLSELIEACGDKFGVLEKIYDKNQWHCRPCTGKCMYFSTPEEAVARLWLELNKK